MSTTTPNIGLDELVAAQAQPHVPVNESFRRLDTLVQANVKGVLSTPPGSPVDGDRYIVGPAATGLWATREDNIVYYVAGDFNEWRYLFPHHGWLVFQESPEKYLYYGGTSPFAWLDTGIL